MNRQISESDIGKWYFQSALIIDESAIARILRIDEELDIYYCMGMNGKVYPTDFDVFINEKEVIFLDNLEDLFNMGIRIELGALDILVKRSKAYIKLREVTV